MSRQVETRFSRGKRTGFFSLSEGRGEVVGGGQTHTLSFSLSLCSKQANSIVFIKHNRHSATRATTYNPNNPRPADISSRPFWNTAIGKSRGTGSRHAISSFYRYKYDVYVRYNNSLRLLSRYEYTNIIQWLYKRFEEKHLSLCPGFPYMRDVVLGNGHHRWYYWVLQFKNSPEYGVFN